jgi:hypothetical protein
MDPDRYRIRIRIGIQPKMLDPDPDEMNADPQPCFIFYEQGERNTELRHSQHGREIRENCYTLTW